MGLAVVHSRAQVGIDAPAVTVEVHLANGLPTSEQIPASALEGHEFIGELALTGELRPVRGSLDGQPCGEIRGAHAGRPRRQRVRGSAG